MGDMKYIKRPKIVMVPYPAQGHVTPMFKLASAILSHGFQPIIIVPQFIYQRILKQRRLADDQDEILCMSIPDGLEEKAAAPPDFSAIEMAMENHMPIYLDRLVRKLNEDGGEVVCVIVDLVASWAIKVANQCGVAAVGFWPAMLATYNLIAAIPDMVRQGLLSETGIPEHADTLCYEAGEAVVSGEELPWLIGNVATRNSRFKFWMRTLNRSRTLEWLLVNSFPEECNTNIEKQQIQTTTNPLVFPIGPLSKHSKSTVAMNPASFWEEDMSSIDWLDKQKRSSVVYVSFGSWVCPIGEGKVKDLALSLEALEQPFLWVLGLTWRDGLPVGYIERVLKKQGKVVSWAPQMEVLQHKAVGCYLTHCGWNSTMEAIQCQKRLLCYPIAGDQFVNCAYIVQVWKIGVRIDGFGRKCVEEGVRRVMDDGEMGMRLMRLYEQTMGEEACLRVMGNLSAFIHNLSKFNSGSSVNALKGFE